MENINNKEKNFVSAVVYLRNNETGIVNFVRGLNETLSSFFAKYEIIIVNDCSSDKSVERVKEYAKENNVPIIQDEGLAFLLTLVRIKKPIRILEIGVMVRKKLTDEKMKIILKFMIK